MELIVLQALVLAHERLDLYGHLLNSVRSVIFFGVPHRGSDRDSACLNLPNERAVGIAGANHRTMCKFATSESQKYRPVRAALDALVKAANPETELCT